jgi:hypothetical protein
VNVFFQPKLHILRKQNDLKSNAQKLDQKWSLIQDGCPYSKQKFQMANKQKSAEIFLWNLEVKWKTMWAITCLLRASSFVLFHLSILYCTCFICCSFLGINDYALWIGANDLRKEGKWTWISDHSTLAYSYWRTGEPSNSRGVEDCGQLYKQESGTWNDAECSQRHGYICEKW